LKASYEKAKKLIRENRETLDRIAQYLFEHETITGKQFMDIMEGREAGEPYEVKTEAVEIDAEDDTDVAEITAKETETVEVDEKDEEIEE